MNLKINGLNINYTTIGKGKNLIFLHGWGRNKDDFNSMAKAFKNNYKVWLIDLPGFGESDTPKTIYGTHEYANIINTFIKKLNIDSPTLIGHSFGGKIIIDLLTTFDKKINKVILIDSAGIKKKKSFIKKYKTYMFKLYSQIIKKLYNEKKANYLIDDLKDKYGSLDYKMSKGIMKDILVKVIHEDYTDSLNKIKASTLLLWGELDFDTPISDGKIMNEKIKDSGLVTIKSANHFPFITHLKEIIIIINNFLEN